MITEFFIGIGVWIAEFILGLFDFDLPDFFTEPPTVVQDLGGMVASLGVWVPWGVLSSAVFWVFALWVIFFLVKLVRQLVAHVPQVGGSG